MSILDASIVLEVRETLGDDVYRDFVRRMLDEAAQIDARLKSLSATGNMAEVASVAHRMAGSAVAVGATALHARLKAIEDAVRLEGAAGVPALIDGLDAVIAQTKAAMDDILR